MKPEDIKPLIEEALRNPANFPWLAVATIVVVVAAAAFLGAYLAEKGKSVATKEDIRELTSRVESVKYGYTKDIEHLKGDIQYRNIALERRLHTHQKAFALIVKSILAAYGGMDTLERMNRVTLRWWSENCLYFSPEASEAFNKAIVAIMELHIWTEEMRSTRKADLPKRISIFESIDRAMTIIRRDVQLPEEYGSLKAETLATRAETGS